ncbi:MAG: AEC family transporter [Propionibacteriaceae bacterium]|nr:AEC family transporter [Propionibacteriaceae bacterium]
MGVLSNALPALQGFFTIGVLIGLGWLLARVGVLSLDHRKMMSFLALYVASPALMFTIMVQADLSKVFAHSVIAAYGSIAIVASLSAIVSKAVYRRDAAETTIDAMLACYSNAGNLGIPVAAYALKDVTWVVPILLVQLVILQPFTLAVLDWRKARLTGIRPSVASLISLPVRNPLTLSVLLGLAINLIHGRVSWFALPDFVNHPIQMLGDVAVPMMLLAFGISLCLDPKPAQGAEQRQSWFVASLKVLVQPLVAYILAAWVLHLDPTSVRAVTVVSCLPSAQNLFVIASRYEVRMVFARDTIFRGTVASVFVILVAATVLA